MKTIKTWLTTIAILLCSITVNAHDFVVDGIYYKITSSTDLTVSVTYSGDFPLSYNEYNGDVIIPASVMYDYKSYSVISIGAYAFKGCTDLTSINIQGGVISVGNEAFMNCSSLNSVNLNSGITSLGQSTFENCTSLTILNLPESLESIPYKAFASCSSLSSINFPNNLREIGQDAFYGCLNLTSVSIPSSVTSLVGDAFENTGWFEDQLNGVLYLDNCCLGYKGGKPQGSLSIKEGTRLIAGSAFSDCSSLTSITIPSSVKSIGRYAFAYCSGLTSINIPNSITSIDYGTFRGCSGLTSVNLPNSITSIGSSAFELCSSLTSIAIPNSVTSIGSGAFSHCSNLTSITIPKSVTQIDGNTFYNCSKLTSVSFPNSITHIESSAFIGCASVVNIISQNPTPPLAYSLIFNDAPATVALYVPVGSKDSYASATGWKNIKNIFEQETFVNNYTITYVVDEKVYKTETVACGAEIIPIEKPTKEGYTFVGWNDMLEVMPDRDITIYGTFVINKYLVTFKVENEIIYSESLEYGANIVVPKAPEKEGYTFEGWGDVATTVPANDVTYEGGYSVNTYQLIYEVDGETVRVINVDYGSTITLIDEPEKVGHSFSGWSEVPMTMPAKDLTISGTFTINEYLVTFKANDVVISSESLVYGTAIVAPNAPELEDYIFVEWDDLLETVPAYDVEFTAVYNQVNVRIKDDMASFSQGGDVRFDKIYYTRNFANTNWQALYVPFEIPVTEELLADFEVADLNDIRQYDRDDDGVKDETIVEAFKVRSGATLAANYPYLIRAKEAGEKTITVTDATLYATEEVSIDCSSIREKFTFTGTYSRMESDELAGCYALCDGVWQPLAADATLGAFRVYLQIESRNGKEAPARAIRIRVIGEGDVTEIEEMESVANNQQAEVVYDLQGRRITNADNLKGVYIVNGKKVVK